MEQTCDRWRVFYADDGFEISLTLKTLPIDAGYELVEAADCPAAAVVNSRMARFFKIERNNAEEVSATLR